MNQVAWQQFMQLLDKIGPCWATLVFMIWLVFSDRRMHRKIEEHLNGHNEKKE